MRKSFWIILAVLFVAIGAPNAHANATYAISFSGTGAPTVVGSDLIDYNPGIQEFTTPSFTMIWDGHTFDMGNLDPSNQVDIAPSEITWGCAVDFYGYFSCIITNLYGIPLAGSTTQIYGGAGGPDLDGTNPEGNGSVILTAQTAQTPEPGTAILWLTGMGLIILMRKRVAQLLRLDTGTHRALSLPAHH